MTMATVPDYPPPFEIKANPLRLGFTGAQRGMKQCQRVGFIYVLRWLCAGANYISEFHHGDCLGADSEAHYRVLLFGKEEQCKRIITEPLPRPKIYSHPCTLAGMRAHVREADIVAEPADPLERNHRIVDACDIMIATPREAMEMLRSGTWSTLRYAHKVRRRTILILPNGRVDENLAGRIGRFD